MNFLVLAIIYFVELARNVADGKRLAAQIASVTASGTPGIVGDRAAAIITSGPALKRREVQAPWDDPRNAGWENADLDQEPWTCDPGQTYSSLSGFGCCDIPGDLCAPGLTCSGSTLLAKTWNDTCSDGPCFTAYVAEYIGENANHVWLGCAGPEAAPNITNSVTIYRHPFSRGETPSFTPTSPAGSTPSEAPEASEDEARLETKDIIGITVGIVAAIAAVISAYFAIREYRRSQGRRRSRRQRSAPNIPVPLQYVNSASTSREGAGHQNSQAQEQDK